MSGGPVRVGIDVGGTFTHAVALAATDLSVLGKARRPTTHNAPEGVARGVVESLRALLAETGIDPSRIAFIAHSTTQATNALLEGDVATVGVVCVGRGLEGRKASADTKFGELALPNGSRPVLHHYVDLDACPDLPDAAGRAIESLAALGARVVVAAEAFSVEDASNELAVMEAARAGGMLATGTHEVSGLYGLRARTRTSALNASILPKMMAAATATESAVRAAGVAAPLMIVRSDGGVMNVEEVARRPVQTLLSGPAAGLAAAVTHVGLADGVFLEVGGTSTDISAIVDGRPRERTATVGGRRLHLRTLDIDTIAVAGGSMPRVRAGKLVGVGPRSAHIAGLPYASFDPDCSARGAEVIAPLPGDPSEYLVLSDGERRWAFTLTCARRTLEGQCPPRFADVAAAAVGMSGADFARSMLRTAGKLAADAAAQVAARAELAGVRRRIVGGGGGCQALLPSVAECLSTEWAECPDAEVISAIGVARAVLRESIERNMPSPDAGALLALRREVAEALVAAGAARERIEVQVEVDSAAGTVRATATGGLELDAAAGGAALPEDELHAAAQRAAGLGPDAPMDLLCHESGLAVFQGSLQAGGFLGRFRKAKRPVVVVESSGRVRLQREDARTVVAEASAAADALRSLVEYGDHGSHLPPTQVVADGCVIDLSGVGEPEQAVLLLREETSALAPRRRVVLVRG